MGIIESFDSKIWGKQKITRDILYALPECHGLGLRNLYITQGINHVAELIEHQWKQTITGHFQTISLEILCLELGVNDHILSLDYDKHKPLIITDSWMTHTWKFMHEYNIKLNIDPPCFTKNRENDTSIMSRILNNPHLTDSEITIANKCRIYLQVFIRSDIVSGDGKTITSNSQNGIRSEYNKNPSLKWPMWARPTRKMWKIWNSVLHSTFCSQNAAELDTSGNG